MFKRLEDQLQAGERVVFRARYGLVSGTVLIGSLALVLKGMGLGVDWLFNENIDWDGVPAVVLIFAGYFLWWIWSSAVLVTDRRVLYSQWQGKRKTGDVPLKEIDQVTYTPGIGAWGGFVGVSRKDGGNIALRFVPKLQDLRDAIAAQCGLLVPPRVTFKLRFAVGLATIFGCFGILSAMIAYLYLILQIADMADGVVLRSDIAFYGFLASVPLGFVLSGVLGGIFGHLLGLVSVRALLTAEQAEEFLHTGTINVTDGWFAKISKWSGRQSARILNRLYGGALGAKWD